MAPNAPYEILKDSDRATLQGNEVPFTITEDRPRGFKAVREGLKNLSTNDFRVENMTKMPCLQQASIYGVSTGLSMGAIRYVVTRNVRSTGNWGFLTFGIISMVSWEYCRFQRKLIQLQFEMISAANNELPTKIANPLDQ
ncbi:hypothetical protein BJ742DRAFT_814842 [Cladochytrium replicatum]|nr:hypothetical protein BJ742DRAFT_814842 [Cladochytrium replicatum]